MIPSLVAFNERGKGKLPAYLGIVFTQSERSALCAELELKDFHMAPNGFLHAGSVVTLADTTSAVLVFETGLPTRYYLPLSAVRMDLLQPSDTSTHCPYKGNAAYWSVRTDKREHKDVAWIYRTPLPESQKIAGLACFYNERVDIYLDDEKQSRPKSPLA